MMASFPLFFGVLFGAAYYTEYRLEATLIRDLNLMRDAKLHRHPQYVGESTWSTWEPEQGVLSTLTGFSPSWTPRSSAASV